MNNGNDNYNAAPIPVGFRFHPTDEELVGYYLHGKVGRAQRDQLIQELDLYKIEPWDLHELCRIGDDAAENQSDWYFFSHKDKKYPTGNRANRATAAGFWKATGRDKPIHTQRHVIGMRKTLVFYRGRAPHGQKTDWIMHEFRLDSDAPGVVSTNESDGWVVCRVFRKTKNFKTKSQEDTSCSFEEDQPLDQVGPNQQLLSESTTNFMSATAKHSQLTENHHNTGSAISAGNVGEYNPHPHAHHFNFTCKQEISVDDYGTPIHHHHHLDPAPSSFTVMDSHHLHEGTVTGHGLQGPSGSALMKTCLRQSACRTKLLSDHHREFYSAGPAFHGDSTSTLKDNFDDARSSSTTTAVTQEAGSCSFPNNEDWMPELAARDHNNILRLHTGSHVRRDQTLADVTCHIHIKRQTPTSSDRLFVSHENLVHLWNV